MTSTIFWENKRYACEFIKNVSSDDIGNLRIYVSRHDKRAFLVTEFNEVLATETLESYEIDALIDEEDCNYIYTTINLCCDFGQELNTIIRND